MSLFRARTKSAFSSVAPRDIERDGVAIRRADFFLARARGRALQKTIARTFECPSFPRAFSPILDSKCRSKSTGAPLSLNREVSRSSRFRVHATSRAISRARAPTQKCGFLSKRFALFRVLLLCLSRRSSRFSFTSRAPNYNEMQNTKVTRREKKRDDQRHRHGSNELLFFLSFLLGPRASLAHSRSFFHISILGFQRISFFFIFITIFFHVFPFFVFTLTSSSTKKKQERRTREGGRALAI